MTYAVLNDNYILYWAWSFFSWCSGWGLCFLEICCHVGG